VRVLHPEEGSRHPLVSRTAPQNPEMLGSAEYSRQGPLGVHGRTGIDNCGVSCFHFPGVPRTHAFLEPTIPSCTQTHFESSVDSGGRASYLVDKPAARVGKIL